MVSRFKLPPLLTIILTLLIYTVLSFVLFRERPEMLGGELAYLVSALPHVIAVVNTFALISLYLGYRAIKRRDINSHKIFMITAVILILAFLIMYVTRVSLECVKEFKGPEEIKLFIYLPMLFIHVALSIISVPTVVYNILSGFILSVEEIPRSRHPKIGKLAVWMWGISLFLGVVVYLMLNYIR